MPQETNKIPSGTRQWIFLGGGAVLVVFILLGGILFRGGRPDPNQATRLDAERLTGRVEKLLSGGKFDAAAKAIESFLNKHPDAPDLPLLWALRIVSHRKSGDVTQTLKAMEAIDKRFQGRGGDLCDVGDILVRYECYRDAAMAFKLAALDASVGERAYYQAATCNYRLGRFAMAMEQIDAAAALAPNDPKITAAVKKIEDARFVADE